MASKWLRTYNLGMSLKSLSEMPNLAGKRVLLRVDHNVQMNEDGTLKDDRKMRLSLPTIEMLIERGAALILMTHVGRPKGKVVAELRTKTVAEHLKTLSPKITTIKTLEAVTGDEVQREADALKSGEILYLENVRFFPEEKNNDETFMKEIASLADFYVNEAFPSIHAYEEASTCGVARLLPAFAGLQLQKEVEHLSAAINDPRPPLVLILSGAKMKTKIPVIKRFLDSADHILLGGCIANTFIAARGFDVGSSKYEESNVEFAREIMLESEQEGKAMIHIPRDVVVASEPSEDAEKLDLPVEDIAGDMKIFDIGKVTIERYKKEIEKAGTIIWNGPLGLYEFNRFSHATKRIAEAVSEASKKGAFSVVGGGDTLDFFRRYDYSLDDYSFVSSGGGAMLEFLSAEETLPALVPLQSS
jgi:3-phosphoglycerate kinase